MSLRRKTAGGPAWTCSSPPIRSTLIMVARCFHPCNLSTVGPLVNLNGEQRYTNGVENASVPHGIWKCRLTARNRPLRHMRSGMRPGFRFTCRSSSIKSCRPSRHRILPFCHPMFFFIRPRDCLYQAYLKNTSASVLMALLYRGKHHTIQHGRTYQDNLV
jgi:hypothetical protein